MLGVTTVSKDLSRTRGFLKGLKEGVSAEKLTRAAAEFAEQHVETTVRGVLESTLSVYLRNFKVEYTDNQVEMTLRGPIANLQEKGTTPFPLGQRILGSRERVVVPFTHTSADVRATTRSKPLGYALRKELGREGARAYGKAMEAGHQPPVGVYSGLKKMSDGKMMTFRTITRENAANGWKYPRKRGLFAMKSAAKATSGFLRDYVAGLAKDAKR